MKTIRRAQEAISRIFGPEYKVMLLGSTCYGVDSPTSDLDLVIFVSYDVVLRKCTYSPDYARILRTHEGSSGVEGMERGNFLVRY